MDFAAKVADLHASCSAVVSALPRHEERPLPEAETIEAALVRAQAGDVEAQAEMAELCLMAGKAIGGMGDPYLEFAEVWARRAADAGSARADYTLAYVLLFRSGHLAGLGFRGLSAQLATEALDLLNTLADEGVEEAALSIVKASEDLAEAGIAIAPRAPWEG